MYMIMLNATAKNRAIANTPKVNTSLPTIENIRISSDQKLKAGGVPIFLQQKINQKNANLGAHIK